MNSLVSLALSIVLVATSASAQSPPRSDMTSKEIIEAMKIPDIDRGVELGNAGKGQQAGEVDRNIKIGPTTQPNVSIPTQPSSTSGSLRAVDFKVYFSFDSAMLDPRSTELLREIASALRSDDLMRQRFVVEGHTDAVGGSSYNDRLSLQRADAVVGFLSRHGVPSERLSSKGFGSRDLLVKDSPTSALNRRVRITTQRLD
jgi:outer membrane protein OmpA-like peptidoglycan-associated protein